MYNIKKDECTGEVSCIFTHNGRKYVASIMSLPEYTFPTTKCVIYSTLIGDKPDYMDVVYQTMYLPANEQGLIRCIEDFTLGRRSII